MSIENSELHVIILWEEARFMEDKILADIEKKFRIRAKYFITWGKDKAYENFSRFYAIKSRYAKGKMRHCGSGEFLMLVVEDSNPVYGERKTTEGLENVNTNLFDIKMLYRKWTHEGHKVHVTNSIAETNHNLCLFFGMTYQEYLNSLGGCVEEVVLHQNLIGSDGWNSFEELFKTLNATVEYVVLRNFENFFEEIVCDEHLDIDLLVSNYNEVRLVSKSKEMYPYNSRVVNQVMVDGEVVNFDFRSVNDNYMDSKWSTDIIKNRVFDVRGFYKPNKENYFYSLVYHALLHKTQVSDDYLKRLKLLGSELGVLTNKLHRGLLVKILDNYLKTNDLKIVEPNDVSVFYNLSDYNQKVTFLRRFLTTFYVVRHRIKKTFFKR